MNTNTLTATIDTLADDIYVIDDEGGIWRPTDSIYQAIMELAADEREEAAVRWAQEGPKYGTWKA